MNKKTGIILCATGILIVAALSLMLLFKDFFQMPENDATTDPAYSTESTAAESLAADTVDFADTTEETTASEETGTSGEVGGLTISAGVETLPGGDRGQSSGSKPGETGAVDESLATESTEPAESTGGTTATTPDVDELTYEEYSALSPDEQYAYALSLGVEAYVRWKNAAIADYNARHPDETITGGPVIDLGG